MVLFIQHCKHIRLFIISLTETVNRIRTEVMNNISSNVKTKYQPKRNKL